MYRALIITLIIFSSTVSAVYAANHLPRAGVVVPANGSAIPNKTITFTAAYIDPDGYRNLAACHLRINNTTGRARCFSGLYNGRTNKMYILNDTGKKWIGGYAPGARAFIENSYVRVDCSISGITPNGNTLAVKWAVSFKSKFKGPKNMYMRAIDKNKAASGRWLKRGTWTVLSDTLSVSVDPSRWNIGAIGSNSVTTMPQGSRITITNDGSLNESFELKLINPPGWTAGSAPGVEQYSLSAIICGPDSMPMAADFNADSGSEDTLTVDPKKATASVFAAQGAGNGLSLPPENKRALYLQFKSPVKTASTAENNISIIVNCQAA